jgi:hypothetical protein
MCLLCGESYIMSFFYPTEMEADEDYGVVLFFHPVGMEVDEDYRVVLLFYPVKMEVDEDYGVVLVSTFLLVLERIVECFLSCVVCPLPSSHSESHAGHRAMPAFCVYW